MIIAVKTMFDSSGIKSSGLSLSHVLRVSRGKVCLKEKRNVVNLAPSYLPSHEHLVTTLHLCTTLNSAQLNTNFHYLPTLYLRDGVLCTWLMNSFGPSGNVKRINDV